MSITYRHSGMEPRQHRMLNDLRSLIFGYFLKEKYLMDLVSEEALHYRIHWEKKLHTGESLLGSSGLLSHSAVTSAKKRI